MSLENQFPDHNPISYIDYLEDEIGDFNMPETPEQVIDELCMSGGDPIASALAVNTYLREYLDDEKAYPLISRAIENLNKNYDEFFRQSVRVHVRTRGGIAMPNLDPETCVRKQASTFPELIMKPMNISCTLRHFSGGNVPDDDGHPRSSIGINVDLPLLMDKNNRIDNKATQLLPDYFYTEICDIINYKIYSNHDW